MPVTLEPSRNAAHSITSLPKELDEEDETLS